MFGLVRVVKNTYTSECWAEQFLLVCSPNAIDMYCYMLCVIWRLLQWWCRTYICQLFRWWKDKEYYQGSNNEFRDEFVPFSVIYHKTVYAQSSLKTDIRIVMCILLTFRWCVHETLLYTSKSKECILIKKTHTWLDFFLRFNCCCPA